MAILRNPMQSHGRHLDNLWTFYAKHTEDILQGICVGVRVSINVGTPVGIRVGIRTMILPRSALRGGCVLAGIPVAGLEGIRVGLLSEVVSEFVF